MNSKSVSDVMPDSKINYVDDSGLSKELEGDYSFISGTNRYYNSNKQKLFRWIYNVPDMISGWYDSQYALQAKYRVDNCGTLENNSLKGKKLYLYPSNQYVGYFR